MHTSKSCSMCKETKPLTEFTLRKGHKGKISPQSRCKACVSVASKESKAKRFPTKEEYNAHMVEYRKSKTGAVAYFRGKARRQGLSNAEADRAVAAYKAHDGNCEICRKELANIYLDHCHETVTFRGLLCNSCNTMLGYAYDNPDILIAGAAYLQERKRQDRVEA